MYFNVEYEIEKRIIKSLRSIFENDEQFVYNGNGDVDGLKITTDFPEGDVFPYNTPHLVVAGVSFQDNLHNSFSYNFMNDVEHEGVKNCMQQYSRIIPYSVNIIAIGTRNDSKDLASRLHHYISFGACQYISEYQQLQISGISKSQTSPSKQYPKKVFETSVNIRGTLHWVGTKHHSEVLDDVNHPLHNIKIKF